MPAVQVTPAALVVALAEALDLGPVELDHVTLTRAPGLSLREPVRGAAAEWLLAGPIGEQGLEAAARALDGLPPRPPADPSPEAVAAYDRSRGAGRMTELDRQAGDRWLDR